MTAALPAPAWLPIPPGARAAAARLLAAKRSIYASPREALDAGCRALERQGCRVFRSPDPSAVVACVMEAVAGAGGPGGLPAGGGSAASAPPPPVVAWHPGAVQDAVGLADALDAAGVFRLTVPDRARLFAAAAGITGATGWVRDTGTLVLVEDSGFARAVSNVPPVHIALVTPDKLIPKLDDVPALVRVAAAAWLGRPVPRYTSLITGPSRTGDIAFRLVMGMHGPRVVHVVVWEAPWAEPPPADSAEPAGLPARWLTL